ncbi:MAG: hypothetical protein ACI4WS_08590 [Oscillospiraceae bacterium]
MNFREFSAEESFDGFRWLDCGSALKRCCTMQRRCDEGAQVVCVMNFSDLLKEITSSISAWRICRFGEILGEKKKIF